MTLSYDMLGVAQRAAPDAETQQAFAKIRQEMQAAEEPDNNIVLAIAEALIDGLRYQNWPGATNIAWACIRDTRYGKPGYNLIQAIKEYRTRTGASLREAKEAIDREWKNFNHA